MSPLTFNSGFPPKKLSNISENPPEPNPEKPSNPPKPPNPPAPAPPFSNAA
ncbi:hypothetical protein [Oceanivirga salmonicida]|uniref:hypothetical protein n=1 Tax=Oceanivirga salmonicida TaxID=1769291 RepID=UPI0012E3AAAB|nr:hypothetical protein [Oceanivirga salmonicida]